MSKKLPWVVWFKDITLDDVATVGGKNASLGEMTHALKGQGVNVPDGFAITADAYWHTLRSADLVTAMTDLLDGLDRQDMAALSDKARRLREMIYNALLPADLQDAITNAYSQLEKDCDGQIAVAVRSSATAEDLPSASFAGQHESFLNIRGVDQLLVACHRCFASLFTDRAISYRIDQGFDHMEVGLSVGVQTMVNADEGAAGVAFTLDTESGFRDVVFLTGAYGLGETVVQGTVDPDEFYVHKPTFKAGHRAVLRRKLGAKQQKMIYATNGHNVATCLVDTPDHDRARYCLSDTDVLDLAGAALTVEEHYSTRAGHDMPMDIEWVKDGETGELHILQARPETVISQRTGSTINVFSIDAFQEPIAVGRAIGEGVAQGKARLIADVTELESFATGEVLVAETTTPDWEPVLKKAAAVVTDKGGRTCHAAIVARELGIPAIVGTGNVTETVKTGDVVTASCAEGEAGKLYAGEVPFETEAIDVASLERPHTQIMLNVGNPDIAFMTSFLPNDGVGLARLEFIISEYVRAHPMALLYPERVDDQAEEAKLKALTAGYENGAAYFVEKLSDGVGTIAAAFYPKPVIVRMSDFKSNEYATLLGGQFFERAEANPMIGFRGASRYAHPDYQDGFALECQALRRVRETMGLTNVRIMIPFCRRVEEAQRTLAVMAENGLERGKDGLEIFVMCEIPSNVLSIDAFAELFDGFSIGSNDLTQLILGVDRDSEIVAFDFDERDPAVLEALRLAIEGAKRNGCHAGICGQAPSDYPDFAAYLVELGIDSISLTPDSVVKTTRAILEAEKAIAQAKAG